IVLKLAGELGGRTCAGLDSVIAVNPPIDLAACSARIGCWDNRGYDRHFLGQLMHDLAHRVLSFPDAESMNPHRRPRSLFEFDDLVTAPVSGYGNAANYYRTCSSGPMVAGIRLPTLIITAADDPLIPRALFDRLNLPGCVQ